MCSFPFVFERCSILGPFFHFLLFDWDMKIENSFFMKNSPKVMITGDIKGCGADSEGLEKTWPDQEQLLLASASCCCGEMSKSSISLRKVKDKIF